MSFQHLLHRCYRFSSYKGYDFDIFEGVYRHCVMSQESLERSLGSQLFNDARFVYARDLGCQHLGRSINEVLQTLICASEDATFCPYRCGCSAPTGAAVLTKWDTCGFGRQHWTRYHRTRGSLLHDWSYNSTVFLWLCVLAKPWRGCLTSDCYLAWAFRGPNEKSRNSMGTC